MIDENFSFIIFFNLSILYKSILLLYNLIMNDIIKIIANIDRYKKICSCYDATLVLATKYVSRETLEALANTGEILTFGENRVQDFNAKYFVSPNVSWQFIGRLQTNKVKYLIGKVDLIQSVDRIDLVKEISKQSARKGVVTNILIEVNVGLEEQKGGVTEDEFDNLIDCLDEHVNVLGVMSVFTKNGDISLLSKKVISLSERLKARCGNKARIISIGMSNDYTESLENGSNMIRLGKAIFSLEE